MKGNGRNRGEGANIWSMCKRYERKRQEADVNKSRSRGD